MPGPLVHWRVASAMARIWRETNRPGMAYITTGVASDQVGNVRMNHLRQMQASRYFFFGSSIPDVPYFNLETTGHSVIADLFHYNRTGEFVLQFLNLARQANNQVVRSRMVAYVLGHISHIVADIIIHPFINLFSGDYHHQVTPDFHRRIEVEMDSWVARDYFRRWDIATGPTWNEFLPDTGEVANRLLESIRIIFGTTYRHFMQQDYIVGAYGRFHDTIISWGYDTGAHRGSGFWSGLGQMITNVHDTPVMEMVNHPGVNITLTELMDQSANISLDLCADAIQFLEGNIQEDQFRSKLHSYDLDTGFAFDVGMDNNVLEITCYHSWGQFPAATPSNSPEPIKIKLTDENGDPVPFAKYRVTSNGSLLAEGTLDENGYAKVEGISVKNYTIEFPDLQNHIVNEE
jgi:hypothetical protein